MLTLANLLSGAAAIVFALQYHDYTTSFMLIIASAVFDFFDGFAARMLGQSSPIGVQLDSLADDISFGLAPSLVLYDAYIGTTSYYAIDAQISDAMRFGVLIIAAVSALRLARFTIDEVPRSAHTGRHAAVRIAGRALPAGSHRPLPRADPAHSACRRAAAGQPHTHVRAQIHELLAEGQHAQIRISSDLAAADYFLHDILSNADNRSIYRGIHPALDSRTLDRR